MDGLRKSALGKGRRAREKKNFTNLVPIAEDLCLPKDKL